jgi:hypothetical protein
VNNGNNHYNGGRIVRMKTIPWVMILIFLASESLLGLNLLPIPGKTNVLRPNVPKRAELNQPGAKKPNTLVLLSFGYETTGIKESVAAEGEAGLTFEAVVEDDADVKPEILGKLLNFPNPFRQAEGTDIGYTLSKDMDTTLRIYDMVSNLIYEQEFKSGFGGGSKGANRLSFGLNTFDSYFLSAGVYFYYVFHKGALLGKGKMAIIP